MDLPPDEALERAWLADDTSAVIEALRRGANPNLRLNNAPVLYTAAVLGRESLVRALLDSGADADARHENDESTALMAVATLGIPGTHDGILHALVSHGAEVNARDREGNTALDFAVSAGNLRSATVLLAHGATGKKQTLVECERLRDEARQAGDRGI
ncbi:MAG: ankyrin repeat domain-containing protein [Planctomycetota bacterium]